MDKLIKGIPDDHMAVINAKAELKGVSSSAHIRGIIRDDVGVMDLVIKDVPYATAEKIQRNAAAAGMPLNDYVFDLVTKEVAL